MGPLCQSGPLTSSNWGSFPAGREKCSAGACPQLGAGCVAQTTPDPSINQCTQFSYLGVPAAAGMNDWYENNYPLPPNSSFPRRRESRGEVRVVAMTLELFHQPMHPNFIPWCAGASRHERLVRKHVPDSDPGCALQSTSMPVLHRRNVPNCRPMAVGGMRKCSAGACPPLGSGWGVTESAVPIRCTKPQLRRFIPWCAGTSRHERQVRKHVPESKG